jgi:hypothetical protein
MQAVKGLSMEKGLCWGALGVAGVMLLTFILDLATTYPYGGLSKTIDIFGILASGVLIYLGWETMRELR